MKFAQALTNLEESKRMTREKWNGGFIYLTTESLLNHSQFKDETKNFLFDSPDSDHHSSIIKIQSHIDKKNDDNTISIGWTPTQEDMFADDWSVVTRLKYSNPACGDSLETGDIKVGDLVIFNHNHGVVSGEVVAIVSDYAKINISLNLREEPFVDGFFNGDVIKINDCQNLILKPLSEIQLLKTRDHRTR